MGNREEGRGEWREKREELTEVREKERGGERSKETGERDKRNKRYVSDRRRVKNRCYRCENMSDYKAQNKT